MEASPGVRFSWEALPALFPALDAPERWLPLLERHARLLEAESSAVRVTSVAGSEQVRRHYAESLELLRIAEEAGWEGEIADVGSGGGFPGMVMAALLPECRVHLIEPLQKRARLLEDVRAELALENVTVHPVRAEVAGRLELRERCGLVTARAVAPMPELLEYTAPLARLGGLLALPKGSAIQEEVATAAFAAATLGVEAAGIVAMRRAVSERIGVALYRKVSGIAERFPRKAGTAGKRPLAGKDQSV